MKRLLAVSLLTAGCLSTPWDRVDLIPSSWDIVSVDGSPLDGRVATLSFGANNSAELRLACGGIAFEFIADTDGSWLTFSQRRRDPSCSTLRDTVDVSIVDALNQVEGWTVVSDTSIALLATGDRSLAVLNAPPASPGT